MLKTKSKTPQRMMNQVGKLKYFHDAHHSKRVNEIRWLIEEFVDIPIANLPHDLRGFTIVQLTDLHLRPFTQLEHIRRAVDKANLLKPDLVVLTGDYVWHDENDILDLAPALGRLKAKYGVFAILGNHDVKTDAAVITAAFERQHIRVLRNEGLDIQVGEAALYLAGIDDGIVGKPDIKQTMENHSGNKPVVLLAHEPDMMDWYSDDTRINLQLSGHTHGGQIQWRTGKPFLLPQLGKKYVQGLYRVNQSWVYTSRGLGSTGLPLRLNCPPEITHLTLISAH